MRFDDTSYDAPDGLYGFCTDFDGMTHRQMLHMLVGVNQHQVVKVASGLSDAGGSILDIANDLKTHMTNLEWESQAGDAFRDWGNKVASATFTLSDYASTAGTQMSNAGQILGEVHKDMPPVPEGAVTTAATYRQHKGVYGPFGDDAEGAHVPPGATTPTTAEYHQAVTEMQTAQTRAADNMTKLGSAYSAATEQMSTAPEPDFPPLPAKLMPPDPGAVDSHQASLYAGGSSSTANERLVRPAAGPVSGAGAEGGTSSEHGTSPGTVRIDGLGRGGAGGGTAVAEPPTRVGTPRPPAPSESLPPSAFVPGDPGAETPYPGSGGPGSTGRGSRGNGLGDEDGGLFGEPSSTGAGGRAGLRTGIGDGIEGGTLMEPSPGGPGGRQLRFSSGTVVGEEPVAMPSEESTGYHPGSGAPFAASEEAGFQRSGASAYGEPGASGMSSERDMSGMGGFPGARGSRTERGRRSGNRPDYVVEEEETWAIGDRNVVPSVLE